MLPKSRLEFYFLQQILGLLLVLPLKLQFVSQQIWIQHVIGCREAQQHS